MKHQIVHALQKYVLNPPIKLLFSRACLSPPVMRSLGNDRSRDREAATDSRLARARIGSQFWLVAEHGMKGRVTSATLRGNSARAA